MLIPSFIDIENVHGYCNARCTMCSIWESKLKPDIMSNESFNRILDRFVHYSSKVTSLNIVGLGESLIDSGLSRKIKYAKSSG